MGARSKAMSTQKEKRYTTSLEAGTMTLLKSIFLKGSAGSAQSVKLRMLAGEQLLNSWHQHSPALQKYMP